MFFFKFFSLSHSSSKKEIKKKEEKEGMHGEKQRCMFCFVEFFTLYNFIKHIVKPCEARRVYSSVLRCKFSFITHIGVFSVRTENVSLLPFGFKKSFFFQVVLESGGKKRN